MARKKIKKRSRNTAPAVPYPRKRRYRRVLSSRVVFCDIDMDSEIDLDVDTERHGVSRGGRGRSV